MEYEPIYDKLLMVDAPHVRINAETLFIFIGEYLYMVYWSHMNEEYSIVCQDTSEWLADDCCSYDTFYAQTEDEVIESINADLQEHALGSLQFMRDVHSVEQLINDEMLEWDVTLSEFNRGVVKGLGIALGFLEDAHEV